MTTHSTRLMLLSLCALLLSSCAVITDRRTSGLDPITQSNHEIDVELDHLSEMQYPGSNMFRPQPGWERNAISFSVRGWPDTATFEIQSLEAAGPDGKPLEFQRVHRATNLRSHLVGERWMTAKNVQSGKLKELEMGKYRVRISYLYGDSPFTAEWNFAVWKDPYVARAKFPNWN